MRIEALNIIVARLTRTLFLLHSKLVFRTPALVCVVRLEVMLLLGILQLGRALNSSLVVLDYIFHLISVVVQLNVHGVANCFVRVLRLRRSVVESALLAQGHVAVDLSLL